MFEDPIERLEKLRFFAPRSSGFEEQEATLALIRDEAQQQPEAARAFLSSRNLNEEVEATDFAYVVEALCRDSVAWHGLLMEQAERALAECLDGSSWYALHAFNSFDCCAEDASFRASLLPLLVRGVWDGWTELKIACIYSLGDHGALVRSLVEEGR
jgi:hypothetical protein